MAENTRLKDLQEAQKRMGQILQTEALKREATGLELQEQITGMGSEIHDQMMGLNGKYDHLTNTLAAIQLQLLNISKGMQVISPLPRIDFARFDGSNPRSWILKCNGYFKLIPNIPDAQKVTLASMHFDGKAASRFQNYSSKCAGQSWNQFLEIVSAGFEELKEIKIIAEFNKLKQPGSYVEYVEKFEELRACMMLINNGDYSEDYFIASFISGLSEEVQSFLTMFEPTTLQQTIDLGRK
ncbi:hypothetical protein DH2020_017540 [Rehmannia glutinosa]|uniref:Ty3 transposon capsid-like protein domain-containing protein n=1 Tax=Rehmannia glutinosa TaxID=99300 RepID=A0ABR0WVF3_REHGL